VDNKIFNKEFYEVKISVKQEKIAELPYYGPLLRGWLKDSIHKNRRLLEKLYPSKIDVPSFFMYSSHKGNDVECYLNFMGYSEKMIKEIVVGLSDKLSGHLGGINCKITGVSYKKRKFKKIKLHNKINVKFITPTALYSRDVMNVMPELKDILKTIVRSTNRFTKYYVKDRYPYKVNAEHDAEIESFNLKTYEWKHKNIKNTLIPLNGILGEITYGMDNVPSEVSDILTLTQFFQIGKWQSYGFGKIIIENGHKGS